MTIRIATAADAAATAHVHMRSIRELCAGHYSSEQIEDWAAVVSLESHLTLIQHPNLLVVVYEDAAGVQGIGVCEPSSGIINAVYVSPDAVNHGIGAALLTRLESGIISMGTARAHLNATLNAAGFYERYGYQNGRTTVNVLPSGVELPCIAYDKELHPCVFTRQ